MVVVVMVVVMMMTLIPNHSTRQILLEQNRDNQTAETTYTLVFGAYDIDVPSNLTITVESPTNGYLSVGTEITSVPDCNSSVVIQVRLLGR